MDKGVAWYFVKLKYYFGRWNKANTKYGIDIRRDIFGTYQNIYVVTKAKITQQPSTPIYDTEHYKSSHLESLELPCKLPLLDMDSCAPSLRGWFNHDKLVSPLWIIISLLFLIGMSCGALIWMTIRDTCIIKTLDVPDMCLQLSLIHKIHNDTHKGHGI